MIHSITISFPNFLAKEQYVEDYPQQNSSPSYFSKANYQVWSSANATTNTKYKTKLPKLNKKRKMAYSKTGPV